VLSRSGESRDIAAVPTAHVADGQPVLVSGLGVTRHAVAGLATALCGLPPPYEQYSRASAALQSNWLWATGACARTSRLHTPTLAACLQRRTATPHHLAAPLSPCFAI